MATVFELGGVEREEHADAVNDVIGRFNWSYYCLLRLLRHRTRREPHDVYLPSSSNSPLVIIVAS